MLENAKRQVLQGEIRVRQIGRGNPRLAAWVVRGIEFKGGHGSYFSDWVEQSWSEVNPPQA
jgi:hypothetical protein